MKNFYFRQLSEYRIAVADLTDYYGQGQIITRVNVPREFRGQGHGTAILKDVLADADAEGMTLFLEVSSSDGLDSDQLYAWYERHGFKHWNGVMRRRPISFFNIKTEAEFYEFPLRPFVIADGFMLAYLTYWSGS